jgi:transposase InsO family protein
MMHQMREEAASPDVGLLHHSDQGCTYASEDYQRILEARGIICSMSRRGNCYDNAVMESFFSTVKSELGGMGSKPHTDFDSRQLPNRTGLFDPVAMKKSLPRGRDYSGSSVSFFTSDAARRSNRSKTFWIR